MKKIRVLHFVDRIGRGGTQAVLYEWAKSINRDNFQFDFLVFMDGQSEYIQKFEDLGCTVYQVSNMSIRNMPKFIRDVNVFLRENNYDIVHGHSKIKNFLFLALAKRHKVSIRIAHSHNTSFQRMKLLGELLKPLIKFVATDLLACSDVAGEWLYGKNAVKNGSVEVIKNGIDVEKFKFNKKVRNEYRTSLDIENAFVVGHVGKYMEQKNHQFLIDIFYEIQKIKKNSILILVGSGHENIIKDVNNKIDCLGLTKKVMQLGLRNDVPNIFQAFDVFLLPSLYEGLPVVGVEAQASGLNCFFSDTITRQVKILDSTEYLSLEESPKVWAMQIIDKSLNSKRETVSSYLKKNGFDNKDIVNRLEELYMSKLSEEIS